VTRVARHTARTSAVRTFRKPNGLRRLASFAERTVPVTVPSPVGDPLSERLSRIRHLSGTSASLDLGTAKATGHGSAYGSPHAWRIFLLAAPRRVVDIGEVGSDKAVVVRFALSG
jgi:hypothetical protein